MNFVFDSLCKRLTLQKENDETIKYERNHATECKRAIKFSDGALARNTFHVSNRKICMLVYIHAYIDTHSYDCDIV